MISLQFNIRNPWSQRFDNVKNWSGKFFKCKAWELEILKTSDVVGVLLTATHRESHAGVSIEVSLLGYQISFRLYDTRHWDYEKEQWREYGKPS